MRDNIKVCLTFPRAWKEGIRGGIHPPLGILYLAAILRREGVSCEVSDYFQHGRDSVLADIARYRPDFLGVSITSPSASEATGLIREVKQRWPAIVIVCGGPHVHHNAVNVMENDDIDIILQGEGEVRLCELVRAYPLLDSIPGLIYRKNGKIVQNDQKGGFESLDALPFPARDLIDMQWYINNTGSVTLVSSRGCPYQCIYCQPIQRKIFGSKIRRRSVSNVISEMRMLKDQYPGDWLFSFEDDSFTADKAWIGEFCDKLIAMRAGFRWSCLSRVNDVDDDRMRMMKRAGLEIICFGVESGSQKILDFMKKGTTVDQILNAFSLAHRHRVIANAFLMIGTPTETEEDLLATEQVLLKIHPDVVQISRTTPMIGSRLHEYCVEENVSNVKSFVDYEYCGNRYPIKLESLTVEDLDRYEKRLVKVFRCGRIRNVPKYIYLLLVQRNRLRRIRSFLRGLGLPFASK